jgi:hypothetical protein
VHLVTVAWAKSSLGLLPFGTEYNPEKGSACGLWKCAAHVSVVELWCRACAAEPFVCIYDAILIEGWRELGKEEEVGS